MTTTQPLTPQEEAIRDVFLKYVRRKRRILSQRDLYEVLNEIGTMQDLDLDKMRGSIETILNDVLASGSLQEIDAVKATASNFMPPGTKIDVSFDLLNHYAADYARQRSLNLAKYLTAQTRSDLQTIIGDSFVQGITPDRVINEIKQLIGLPPVWANAVSKYRQNLTDAGHPAGRVQSMTDTYRNKLLRSRAETIARTEIQEASMWGKHNAWKQAEADGWLPPGLNRIWITAPDEVRCPSCARLSLQVAPVNGYFIDPETNERVERPPRHPNCRCTTGITDNLATQWIRGKYRDAGLDGELAVPVTKSDFDDKAMICFYVGPTVAKRLAVSNGLKPSDMHITLAYLGDANKLDHTKIRELVRDFATSWEFPLSGRITGVGRFNPEDGEAPWIAIPDVPYMEGLKTKLDSWLEAANVKFSEKHGFNPHITLRYGGTRTPTVHPWPLRFSHISLSIGTDRYDYELGTGRERFKKSNPYHDRLGRFTDARNAVRLSNVGSPASDRARATVFLNNLDAGVDPHTAARTARLSNPATAQEVVNELYAGGWRHHNSPSANPEARAVHRRALHEAPSSPRRQQVEARTDGPYRERGTGEAAWRSSQQRYLETESGRRASATDETERAAIRAYYQRVNEHQDLGPNSLQQIATETGFSDIDHFFETAQRLDPDGAIQREEYAAHTARVDNYHQQLNATRQRSDLPPIDRASAELTYREIRRQEREYGHEEEVQRVRASSKDRVNDKRLASVDDVVEAINNDFPEGTYIEAATIRSGYGTAVQFTMYQDDMTGSPTRVGSGTVDWSKERPEQLHLALAKLEVQGAGLAKPMLGNVAKWAQAQGFESLGLEANIDIGGYAWSRFGFVPKSEGQWAQINRQVRERIDDIGDWNRDENGMTRGISLPKSVNDALRSDDPRKLWDISDSTEPCPYRIYHSKTGGYIDGLRWGQALLIDTNWNGVLRFDDDEAMTRFRRYIEKKG